MPNSDSIKAVGRFRFLLYTSIFSAFFPIVSSLYDKHSQPQVDAIRGLTVCLLASLWGYSIHGPYTMQATPLVFLAIFLSPVTDFPCRSTFFQVSKQSIFSLAFHCSSDPDSFFKKQASKRRLASERREWRSRFRCGQAKNVYLCRTLLVLLRIVLFSAVWNYLTVSEDIWIFPWAMVFVFMLLLGVWALCLSGRLECRIAIPLALAVCVRPASNARIAELV